MTDKMGGKLLKALPAVIRDEILRLAATRGGVNCISEIKLRASGTSVAVISGDRLRLFTRTDKGELARTLEILSDGAIYSHRDTICHGYISLDGGIRVGMSGRAHYNGGVLVGVSDVTSLAFRIPTGSFDAHGELTRAFMSCRRGLLLFSPPGMGKTCALRTLAKDLGEIGEEVCVIDERCEFIESDYVTSTVDILRGYKRADGIQIALRTLSPSVIMVDEIGRLSETEAIMEGLSSGVRTVVTAHASCTDDLMRRPALKPLFDSGIADILVGIEMKGGRRTISVTEVK